MRKDESVSESTFLSSLLFELRGSEKPKLDRVLPLTYDDLHESCRLNLPHLHKLHRRTMSRLNVLMMIGSLRSRNPIRNATVQK